MSEEELCDYFLYLKNEKKASRSACTIALCGIKFFYEYTLRQQWQMFDLVRPAKEKKLPVENRNRVSHCRAWGDILFKKKPRF